MAFEAITPLFIPGGLGPPELVVILLIFVLLFGANKIPKLARSTGEAMGEFQKGREEVEQELKDMKDGATVDAGGEDIVDAEAASDDESEVVEETETNEE